MTSEAMGRSHPSLSLRTWYGEIFFRTHQRSKMAKRVIAADVGGTHVRLQVWEGHDSSKADLKEICTHTRSYLSADFNSLSGLIRHFLADTNQNDVIFDACCIAVCGPVEDEERM